MRTRTLRQDLKQLKAEMNESARETGEFGCSSTPAPTPPVSSTDSRNTRVGAGLLNNQVGAGAGVKEEEIKEEAKSKGENKHRGKPPLVSLTERAGFSTPFPEGRTPKGHPFGVKYF